MTESIIIIIILLGNNLLCLPQNIVPTSWYFIALKLPKGYISICHW